MKPIVIISALLVILAATSCYVFYWYKTDPRFKAPGDFRQNPDSVKKYDPANNRNKLMTSFDEQTAWQNYYEQFAPKAGQLAIDFELKDIEDKETFRLSDYRGKQPVALVFGSFT